MEELNDLNALQNMGFTLPSPAYLGGALLFGLIGFAAYRFGKKQDRKATKWIGIVLMFYPYVVPQTWLLYLLGTALTAAIFVVKSE
jgi:hypothetical protein